ncbi:MAG: hypothetical protein WCF18_20655 [Chthoniobacteraceae bacterium]
MNRNFAIGCAGVIVIIVIFVGVVILETPKFLEQGKALVQRTMADELRIAALENSWQPPSATPDSQWFPATAGEWRLERSEPRASLPELNIDRPVQHATYRSSVGPIEVDVLPANDLEKATLIARAEEALANRRTTESIATNGGSVVLNVNRGSSRITTTLGNRTHVKIGSDEHTRFWWLKDTLFIFRARGEADSEVFPEEYLRALSPATVPAEPKLEKP